MAGRTPGAEVLDRPSNCVGDSTDTTIFLSSGKGVRVEGAHEQVSLDFVLDGKIVQHSSN